MASAVESRLAYARLSAVATASRLPTATRGSNNSYTTSWDTTGRSLHCWSNFAVLPTASGSPPLRSAHSAIPAARGGEVPRPALHIAVAAVIRILGAAVVGTALSLGASMSLARPVDLELILAVDASLSVSLDEYLMQVRGLAAALRSPEVIAAIERVGDAGIAVAVVQWSSANQQEMSLGWTHITDGASARAFARRIVPMPRMQLQGNTAIGALVEAALPMFRDNGFEGARRTIDISGDGRSNEGPHTNLARDHAVRERVTINGLAILNRDPWLDDYYRESVVSGPAAFVMAAKDYRDFGSAMMLKLTREIGGLPLARHGDPLAIARSDQ